MNIKNYVTERKAIKNHYDFINDKEIRKNEIYYENKFFIGDRVKRLKTVDPLPEHNFLEVVDYYINESEG